MLHAGSASLMGNRVDDITREAVDRQLADANRVAAGVESGLRVIMHIIVGIASIIPFVKSSLQSVMRTYLSPSLLTVAPLSYLSATAVYIQNNNSSGTLLMGCIALAVSVFAILMSPAKSFFYIPLTLVISGQSSG